MGRSQRHRLQLQGVVSNDIKGQTPSAGTYDGDNMRLGATVPMALTVRGRAGGTQPRDGVAGPGTQDVAGYIGFPGAPVAVAGKVDGVTGPREGIGPGPSTPPITAFTPTTSSQVAAGAAGRTVYGLTGETGGEPPYKLALASNPTAIAVAISGNTLVSTADPIGTVGAHTVGLTLSDNYGNHFTQNVTINLT